jgi:flagellar basal body-associated protein FliL
MDNFKKKMLLLKKTARYWGAPLLVLILFSIGYGLTTSKTPAKEVVEVAEVVQEEDIVAGLDETGSMFLAPIYRYYTVVFPFNGNITDSNKLFSIELAFGVHKNKIEADAMIISLDDYEPRLRPSLFEVLMTMALSDARSVEGKLKIRKHLTEAANSMLIELGDEPFIDDVVFINFSIL